MSDWINFVKKFARENGLTYGEALKRAAPYYKGRGSNGRAGSKSKRRSSHRRSSRRVSLNKRSSGGARRGSRKLGKYHKAGRLLAGLAKKPNKPKGALAALLSGLDARISVD
jgi:hypothetical protein